MGLYKRNKDSIDLISMLVGFISIIFLSREMKQSRLDSSREYRISINCNPPDSTELHEISNKRTLDSLAIELIKKSEGFNKTWKKCPKGINTIGYGFTRMKWKGSMNKLEADSILNIEYYKLQKNIEKSLGEIKLKDNQLAALTVFSYNVGFTAFTSSRIFKHIKSYKFHLISKELKRWVYIKVEGKVILLAGLVKRREKESELWKLELS